MKKKHVFEIGDRVGMSADEDGEPCKLQYNEEEEPIYGVITDITTNGRVIINWDEYYMNTSPAKAEDPKCLMLETDIKSQWTILEKEYDALFDQIKLKLKDAAKIIKEAGALAKEHNRVLPRMYPVYNDLYRAMDDAGWRTSSFGC